MKIWGQAESQAWENLINALFTKSLPRAKIAEYIKESDICIIKEIRTNWMYYQSDRSTNALQPGTWVITQKEYEEIMATPDDDED